MKNVENPLLRQIPSTSLSNINRRPTPEQNNNMGGDAR